MYKKLDIIQLILFTPAKILNVLTGTFGYVIAFIMYAILVIGTLYYSITDIGNWFSTAVLAVFLAFLFGIYIAVVGFFLTLINGITEGMANLWNGAFYEITTFSETDFEMKKYTLNYFIKQDKKNGLNCSGSL